MPFALWAGRESETNMGPRRNPHILPGLMVTCAITNRALKGCVNNSGLSVFYLI